MKKKWLILIGIIFISGCIEQDGEVIPQYKDDALKMEIEVAGEVLPGQALNMKARLTNQVEDAVDNVEFRITDFYGLELKVQNCGDGSVISSEDCGFVSEMCGCSFDSIQSLDEKEMSFTFRVPSKEEIARIGRKLEPEFTLEYDYSGETIYLIPIISPSERSTSAKPQLVQSKGPIHVDIKRGVTSSSGSWEIDGSTFSIVFRVEDVLNSRNELIINEEDFEVTLTNLREDEEFDICDFEPKGKDSGICTSDEICVPDQHIHLPIATPLVCAFFGESGAAPWVYGQVKANYDYRYKKVETKFIDVETVID